ncbi:MAG: hypothetical protein RLZZ196_2790 [Bacteroidota bacterium]|jgi:hypothetical protein
MKELEALLATLAFILPVLLIFFEGTSFVVYGWFIDDKTLNEALDQHVPKGCELNPYNMDIISIGEMPFISTVTAGVLGTYYVNSVGRVRFGTLAHKRIKNIHTELKRRYKSNYNQEKSLKEKLNIK